MRSAYPGVRDAVLRSLRRTATAGPTTVSPVTVRTVAGAPWRPSEASLRGASMSQTPTKTSPAA